MRAWVSGQTPGIATLSISEVKLPIANETNMLVRVTHGALNFSDLLMIADQYQIRPPRPFTPGQEIVGIVEEAPPASGFNKGDRIASKILWGGFAYYACVRIDMAIRVPENFSLSQAAALPVSYITALVALDYCAKLKPTDTVLIHAAAGGVGLAAVEVAATRGATIIATAGAQNRLDAAVAHGANHGINYRDDTWIEQVKNLTDGRGVDVILDPVGGKIGENSLKCIALDGKLLIVGFSSGKMPTLAPHRLLLKRASAIGVYWNHDTDQKLVTETTWELERLVASGKINPMVDDRYGFDDLPLALDDLANRRVAGKMVLRISEIDEDLR
ncbi:MAG: NADPH:quinone oxidoreductase family protein [Gammaproteobacteria bacterium]|nr:NADPH:quinone oxidoreductase family protein [Gammaproteobacteria bacterium]